MHDLMTQHTCTFDGMYHSLPDGILVLRVSTLTAITRNRESSPGTIMVEGIR